MRCRVLILRATAALIVAGLTAYGASVATTPAASSAVRWDQAGAARYLDARATWWQAWPTAQRDHGTVCISCHSALPYALARPALRQQMGVEALAQPERVMFDNVARRVTLWKEVEPFYSDSAYGEGKAVGSRTSEAVLNALILASYDARRNHLTEITRTAFNEAWAMQQQTGVKAGGWIWLNFHNAPWESDESEYQGAVYAALAVGMAPDHYRDDPKIQGNVELLQGYLRREYARQPLVNRALLLWASARLPGLLTLEERTALVGALLGAQQADGGWSLSALGSWKRRDNTPLETKSDGYATGLVLYALEENGMRALPGVSHGLAWLAANQSPGEGLWPAWSLNKQRDAKSDVGRFMSDAATGFAVLALERGRIR